MTLIASFVISAVPTLLGVSQGGFGYSAQVSGYGGTIDDNDWCGWFPQGVTDPAQCLSQYSRVPITWGAASGGVRTGVANKSFYVPSYNTVYPNGNYHFMFFSGVDNSVIADSAVDNGAPQYAAVSNFNPKVASLSVSLSTVAHGSAIGATWANIPFPTVQDWLGLFIAGASNSDFIGAPRFTGSTSPGGTGPFVIPTDAPTGAAFELRLFSNKTTSRIAQSPGFAIT